MSGARLELEEQGPLGAALLAAIHAGDVEGLTALLERNAGLESAWIVRPAQACAPAFRYPALCAATDWPGHFPRVAASIDALLRAGADVNARCAGRHCETALHGAASSDDLEALDALLGAGAEIDAAGGVIAGGTALDDAVAFAQWRAARRLVERGARTAVWHAAALGLLDRVRAHFAAGRPRAPHPWGASALDEHNDLNVSLWCAAHGGQRAAAEYLLQQGAERRWVSPWDGLTPAQTAARNGWSEVAAWLGT